ncbi:MAG TPA: hypothetical protein VGN57_19075 [Pirellulaceae bacterium]|nr:hypothetical protein [Pirellulaceae bacterium]
MSNQRISVREAYFETIPGKELFEFVCGDLLGFGIHRIVFAYRPDPTCVIKYQNQPGFFDNVREWDLWNSVKHEPYVHRWLAPCVSISENGIWLVQKRTKPLPDHYKLPDRVPRFMTDLKRQNFGIFEKCLVAHDYANNLCVNHALSKATKKADWF